LNTSVQVRNSTKSRQHRVCVDLHDLDHVKHSLKLLCSDPITSNMGPNCFAQTRSRQTWAETSLLRRDHVVISACRVSLAIFVGTFGPALVTKLTSRRFLSARLVIFRGPMTAIRAEMPGIMVPSSPIGFCHSVPVLFLWKVPG